MTTELHKLLNWKLLSGSHDFPGPEGGTCINEAALVVAGFPYKKIGSASDMPSCFSRPISAFAIQINDSMNDEFRQKLIPFVTRLAGSADKPEVEQARARMMVLRTVREIVAPVFDKINLPDVAMKLRHCTWDDLKQVTAYAAYAAKKAAYAAYAAEVDHIWTIQMSILDEALAMGNQAPPIDTALIVDRAAKAKTRQQEAIA